MFYTLSNTISKHTLRDPDINVMASYLSERTETEFSPQQVRSG